MEKEFKKHLDKIVDSKITYSRAGGGAGSIISMELIDVDNILYRLWIECDWRIQYKNEIIATSTDDIRPVTGLIAKSVKMLEGKVIKSIAITPFYDLLIKFTDDFCLNVFCIFSYDYEFDINWYLAMPEQNISFEITNYFKIKKGAYS